VTGSTNTSAGSPLLVRPSVSVVVPVYNSTESLTELVARLNPVLVEVASSFEVILVNDGSADRSAEVIEELADRYAFVRGINLMRNYGQHNALLCGIRAAKSELIVTLDDDLQNPPEEVPRLVRKLLEGYDVVYGTPARQQHGLWRVLASQITRVALQEVLGAKTARHVSAFRVFRTELREGFAGYHSPFVSIDPLLTWAGARFASLEVQHDPRRLGVSHYSLKKLLIHSLNLATVFTTVPLQVASIVGFSATLFGFGVLCYVLGRYFMQGSSVQGFPFLASIIAIFSGTQLFAIGVIGEYLARMHFRLMGRPPYAIRSQTGSR